MRRIYRWQVPITDMFTILMPIGARILSFRNQGDVPVVWALVDVGAQSEERAFRLYGTGHDVDPEESGAFVGTELFEDGNLVLHLFDRGCPTSAKPLTGEQLAEKHGFKPHGKDPLTGGPKRKVEP